MKQPAFPDQHLATGRRLALGLHMVSEVLSASFFRLQTNEPGVTSLIVS